MKKTPTPKIETADTGANMISYAWVIKAHGLYIVENSIEAAKSMFLETYFAEYGKKFN